MGQASAADLSLRPVITLHVDVLLPYGLVCLDHGTLRPIRSHQVVWPSEASGGRNASRRRRLRAKRCGWTNRMQVLCQRATRPPVPARRRASHHVLGGRQRARRGTPPRTPHRQRVPTGGDRCHQVPTCRHGGWGVRPHDFQGKTTYNGTTGAGQTTGDARVCVVEDGAPRRAALTHRLQAGAGWRRARRPGHVVAQRPGRQEGAITTTSGPWLAVQHGGLAGRPGRRARCGAGPGAAESQPAVRRLLYDQAARPGHGPGDQPLDC
jgi:hypothetical protein